MPVTNVSTDQLDLVRAEEAKGLLRLFSRILSASDGFCLVVFRKDSYIGSIVSDEVITENDLKRRCERIGVRDGDSILRINMGPRPMTISDKLTTQDGYTRPYKLEIEICVSDPRNFAQRYRQSSDPVNLARIAIEGDLQRCARRNPHDDLSEDMLLRCTMQALTHGSNRSFGLEVTAAHKITLSMDPRRAQELEILQKSRLEEQKIREEVRIKQIEIQESTEVHKEEVRGNADVNRLKMQFDQELQSTAADYERSEEEKRKQHEVDMESYLLREKSEQRKITRVYEIEEKSHQIELEKKQDDYLRLKAGQDNAFRRDQEVREQAEKRQQILLDRIGEKAIAALSDRISDRIDGGEKLSTVLSEMLGDYPELRDVFLNPDKAGNRGEGQGLLLIEEVPKSPVTRPLDERSQAHSREQGDVPFTSSVPSEERKNESSVTRQDSSISSRPIYTRGQMPNAGNMQNTSSLPGILRQQDYTINITDLGMTLLQIELAESQRDIACTHTSTAFVISALTDTGPAKRALLTTGDIVVEINGQELDNIQAISRILKSYRPGITVSLSILRGEGLVNVDVQSIR